MAQCIIKTAKGQRCRNSASTKPGYRKDRCSRKDHQASENIFEEDNASSTSEAEYTPSADCPSSTERSSRTGFEPASQPEPMIWSPSEVPSASAHIPGFGYDCFDQLTASNPDSPPSYGHLLRPRPGQSARTPTPAHDSSPVGGQNSATTYPVPHTIMQGLAYQENHQGSGHTRSEWTQSMPSMAVAAPVPTPSHALSIPLATTPEFGSQVNHPGSADTALQISHSGSTYYHGKDWLKMTPAMTPEVSPSGTRDAYRESYPPQAAPTMVQTAVTKEPRSPPTDRTQQLSRLDTHSDTRLAKRNTNFATMSSLMAHLDALAGPIPQHDPKSAPERPSTNPTGFARESTLMSRGEMRHGSIQCSPERAEIPMASSNAAVSRLSRTSSTYMPNSESNMATTRGLTQPAAASDLWRSHRYPSSTTPESASPNLSPNPSPNPYPFDPRAPPFSPRTTLPKPPKLEPRPHSMDEFKQPHPPQSIPSTTAKPSTIPNPPTASPSHHPPSYPRPTTPPTTPNQINPSSSSSPSEYISQSDLHSLLATTKSELKAIFQSQLVSLARAFAADKSALEKRLARVESELEMVKAKGRAEEKNRADLTEDLGALERVVGELGEEKVRFGREEGRGKSGGAKGSVLKEREKGGSGIGRGNVDAGGDVGGGNPKPVLKKRSVVELGRKREEQVARLASATVEVATSQLEMSKWSSNNPFLR